MLKSLLISGAMTLGLAGAANAATADCSCAPHHHAVAHHSHGVTKTKVVERTLVYDEQPVVIQASEQAQPERPQVQPVQYNYGYGSYGYDDGYYDYPAYGYGYGYPYYGYYDAYPLLGFGLGYGLGYYGGYGHGWGYGHGYGYREYGGYGHGGFGGHGFGGGFGHGGGFGAGRGGGHR